MMKKKPNKTTDSPQPDFSEAVTLNPELRERVAHKAYEIYEKRGCVHGLDVEDWLEAQRWVLAETKAETKTETKTETVAKAKPVLRGKTTVTKAGSVLGRP